MMLRVLITTCLSILCTVSFSQKIVDQGNYTYKQLIHEGNSLYKAKNDAVATQKYAAILEVMYAGTLIKSTSAAYNAACCYSLAGNADSSFYHLKILANQYNYVILKHISEDADLVPIHKDGRFRRIANTAGSKVTPKHKFAGTE